MEGDSEDPFLDDVRVARDVADDAVLGFAE